MLYSKKLNLAGSIYLVCMFDCIPNPLGDHRFVYVMISPCGHSILLFFLICFVLLRYMYTLIALIGQSNWLNVSFIVQKLDSWNCNILRSSVGKLILREFLL